MTKYFIYFFAIILTASELAGFAFLGALIALCVRLTQENPNYTAETLYITDLHIIVTSVGALFILGNAIIMFRLLRNYRTTVIKHFHAFVLGIALIVTIWGVWSGYKMVDYTATDRLHFDTLHSMLGWITLALLILEYILGAIIYLTDAVSFQFAENFNGLHGFLGISTLLISAITGVVGISMVANNSSYFTIFKKGLEILEALYESFTLEYRIMHAAAFFMIIFAWNFFYLTVNPYFEWTMIEKY